ncbi:unnamed protein product, partial [Heterotrigona itama]
EDSLSRIVAAGRRVSSRGKGNDDRECPVTKRVPGRFFLRFENFQRLLARPTWPITFDRVRLGLCLASFTGDADAEEKREIVNMWIKLVLLVRHVSQSTGEHRQTVGVQRQRRGRRQRRRRRRRRRRCRRGKKNNREERQTREEGCTKVGELRQKPGQSRAAATFRFRRRRQRGQRGKAAGSRRIGKLWRHRRAPRGRCPSIGRAQVAAAGSARLADPRSARQ